MKTRLFDSFVQLLNSSLLILILFAGALVFASCGDSDDDEDTPQTPVSNNSSCPDTKHPHEIDLGLPSHTKWACCNVGATSPESAGSYYAWGETWEKENYTNGNYEYYDKTTKSFIIIGPDIAGLEYDAATANWGEPWRMPSPTQCKELIEKCTSEWVMENFVYGRKFTGPNGNSIFLPAVGWRDSSGLIGTSRGGYLSSKLDEKDPLGVLGLYISNKSAQVDTNWRSYGLTIRPVATPSHGVIEYDWW